MLHVSMVAPNGALSQVETMIRVGDLVNYIMQRMGTKTAEQLVVPEE